MPRRLHRSQQRTVSHCSNSAGIDPQLYPAHHKVSGWDHNWCQRSSTKGKDVWLTATQTKCLMHGLYYFQCLNPGFHVLILQLPHCSQWSHPLITNWKWGLHSLESRWNTLSNSWGAFMKTFGRPLLPHATSLSFFLPYPCFSLILFSPSPFFLLSVLSSSFFLSLHSRYDIHRDFWGLAVDMFRQFFITQVSSW